MTVGMMRGREVGVSAQPLAHLNLSQRLLHRRDVFVDIHHSNNVNTFHDTNT